MSAWRRRIWLWPLVRWQLAVQVEETTGLDVEIGEVTIGLPEGQVGIGTLDVGGEIRVGRVEVDLALREVLRRIVRVESLNIEDVSLNLSWVDGKLDVGGIIVPLSGAAETDAADSNEAAAAGWTFDINHAAFKRINMALNYQSHLHKLVVDRLQVRTAGVMTSPVHLTLAGQVDDASMSLSGYVRVPTLEANLTATAEQLGLQRYADHVGQDMTGSLSFRQHLTHQPGADGARVITVNGSAKLDNFTIAGGVPASIESFAWEGMLGADLAGDTPGVSAKGALSVDGFNATLTLPLSVAHASWEGEATVAALQPGLSVGASGELLVEEARYGDHVGLAALHIGGPLLVSTSAVTVNSVFTKGLRVKIERDETGQLVGWREPQPVDPAPGPVHDAGPEAAAGPTAEPERVVEGEPGLPVVNVTQLKLEDGSVELDDRSVSPAVALNLTHLKLEAEGVSTVDEFPFTLTGRYRQVMGENPAAPDFTLAGRVSAAGVADVNLTMAGLALYPLGGYLGAEVSRGRLDLKTHVLANDGDLLVENDIDIAGLVLKPAGGDSAEGLPLAVALSLLRDSEGRIQLKVPLELKRGEFGVGVRDVVRKALGNATRRAALTYAKFALQPLGGLLLAKDIAGRLSRPRFDPLAFEQGAVSPDDKALAYIERLAGLLRDRPGPSITACGIAASDEVFAGVPAGAGEAAPAMASPGVASPDLSAPGDASADGISDPVVPVALVIAGRRGLVVRQALVDAGVETDRVFECKPEVGEPGTSPAVALFL